MTRYFPKLQRKTWRVILMALVPLLAILPLPDFWITQLNYIGLNAIVSLGLVLLTGVAGLTSFGQAARTRPIPHARNYNVIVS